MERCKAEETEARTSGQSVGAADGAWVELASNQVKHELLHRTPPQPLRGAWTGDLIRSGAGPATRYKAIIE